MRDTHSHFINISTACVLIFGRIMKRSQEVFASESFTLDLDQVIHLKRSPVYLLPQPHLFVFVCTVYSAFIQNSHRFHGGL